MGSSNIVEIGDITAGIVVQEKPGRYRFYASDAPFRSLEPRAFTSAEQAVRAAHELLVPVRERPAMARDAGPAPTLAGYFI